MLLLARRQARPAEAQFEPPGRYWRRQHHGRRWRLRIFPDFARWILQRTFNFGTRGCRTYEHRKSEQGSEKDNCARFNHEAPRRWHRGVNPPASNRRGSTRSRLGTTGRRSKYGRLLQPGTYTLNGKMMVNAAPNPIFVTRPDKSP